MGQFLKARENTPIMLDFVDETFNQVSFFVNVLIISTGCFAFGTRRNNRFGFMLLDDEVDKIIGIIALVGNQPFKIKVDDQCLCLSDVVSLPSGQDKAQWIAQAINTHMNFGTETAFATA